MNRKTWPGVVCVNCGAEIVGIISHPEILHFTLATLHEANCFGCSQPYTVLTDAMGGYVAHYTAFSSEWRTWPCERVAQKSGVWRKNITEIRREYKNRSRHAAGQKRMF